MADDDDASEEKTEEATNRKIKKAREKGTISTSSDAIGLASLVCVLLYLIFSMHWIMNIMMKQVFVATDAIGAAAPLDLTRHSLSLLTGTLWVLVPLPILAFAAPVAISTLVNKGFVLGFEKLKPAFRKMDPVRNAKEKFKARNVVEFTKVITKTLTIMMIFFVILIVFIDQVLLVGFCDLECGIQFVVMLVRLVVVCTVLFLILVAVIDVLLQNALFLRDQRMTKTELMREFKEDEGDPLVKGARRDIGQQLLSQTMESALENSVAVLTDLTNDVAVGVWHPGVSDPEVQGVVTMAMTGDSARSFVSMAIAKDKFIVPAPDLARRLAGMLPMQRIVSDEANMALYKALQSIGLIDSASAR